MRSQLSLFILGLIALSSSALVFNNNADNSGDVTLSLAFTQGETAVLINDSGQLLINLDPTTRSRFSQREVIEYETINFPTQYLDDPTLE